MSTTGSDTEAPDCNGDAHQSLQRYHGTVTALDATANTVTVQWVEVNDNAQTWLNANGNPEPVVFPWPARTSRRAAAATRVTTRSRTTTRAAGSGGSGAEGGGTLQVGDRVEVEATTDTAGTSLIAVSVHTEGAGNEQHMQDYHGTVTSTDSTASTIAVQWSETNERGHDVARGAREPEPGHDVARGRQRGDRRRPPRGDSPTGSAGTGAAAIQVGDQVEVEATTTSDGAGLVAVNVHADN